MDIRLLDVTNFTFREFDENDPDDPVPAYAILSHVWYKKRPRDDVWDEELDYAEFEKLQRLPRLANGAPPSPQDRKYTKSYEKVIATCREAQTPRHGHATSINFIWIDSICIKKANQHEHSRAIKSMWRFYNRAARCIAWLSDVRWNQNNIPAGNSGFQNIKWFTRGWTLQELLAPTVVHFFNQVWAFVGTRESLSKEIGSRARIAHQFLGPEIFRRASIAQRLSWAAGRTTTEPEDRVYSLLGLFGVDVEVKYGGPLSSDGRYQEAFSQLQVKILERSTDESLFAWRDPSLKVSGLLAPTLECFEHSKKIVAYHRKDAKLRPVHADSGGLHFLVPNWMFGHGNVNSGDLAFAARRTLLRFTSVDLEFFCSTRHPKKGKMRAVAIKLKKVNGAWKRTHCGRLYYPRKVHYGNWVGRLATASWHGMSRITIPSENVLKTPGDAESSDEELNDTSEDVESSESD